MVHRTKPSTQRPARFETLPPDDTGRIVSGDERNPAIVGKRERKAEECREVHEAERYAYIICADGTKRSLRRSPFEAAANYAHAAAEGGAQSTNFPRELQELADAPRDALGRMDIVAVADARRKLGGMAKPVAMDDDERAELREARRARRIERGEA